MEIYEITLISYSNSDYQNYQSATDTLHFHFFFLKSQFTLK